MKTITRTAAIAALALAAASAQAQLYGEIGYSTMKESADGNDVNLGALSGIIGYGLHPNVAVEGMLAFGIKDDTVHVGSIPVKTELEHAYGVFVKPRVMLSPNFELFGRLGYVESKVKASSGGISVSDSDGDWAYGLGGNYYFDKNTYLTVNYMNYYRKHDSDVDGFTIGVGMKF